MYSKDEFLQEFKLRKIIRKAIQVREMKLLKEQNEQNEEEEKLRKIVRYILEEGDIDADTKPAPYESTPVNMLADAFNQILPVLKTGLRKLSKPEERESFRMHMLEKMKSIFDNFDALDLKAMGALGEGDINEQEEEGDDIKMKVMDLDDPDRIVPDFEKERYKAKERTPEDQEKEDFNGFALKGLNPTGARVAFDTFNDSNIQTVLANKRKTLFDDGDKQEFRDFALYNADLWLLTYEEELSNELGQESAFSEVVIQRPAKAKEIGKGEQFAPGAGELEASMETSPEESPELPDIPEIE
jgi:hypothetical protein